MLFSRQLPLPSLIELCRTLRHNLQAGLTVRRVFRQLADKGSRAVRPVAERISQEIERGESVEAALKAEKDFFPPLFVALANVGERSGNLPEVLGELEKFYQLQQRLRRQFISQITLPVLQFLAAILVIALMLWALGVVAESSGGTPIDPFGLGTGVRGALTFLGLVFGTLAGLAAVYLVARRTLRHRAVVDDLMLWLPVLGPCLMAFALLRFCLALRLTLETGMVITSALRLSLRATGNAAFVARTDVVVDRVRNGDEVNVALASARIFPGDFLNIVAVAEEGGRLPEVMIHQADHYADEASRTLTALTRVAGGAVYVVYALLMIFAIIRIFKTAYLGPLGG